MSEKDWEQFFNLLNKIVDGRKPYTEKVAEVLEKAKANGAELNLKEFAAWFADGRY